MNLNSLGLFLSQAGGGAGFNPPWLFPGDTAGFTADPFQQAQSFTTSAGSTLAAPLDLVGRTERIAGSLNLTATSDATRWRYSRYPLVGGVGTINNRFLIPTEDLTNAGWSKGGIDSISGTILLDGKTLNNVVENSASSSHVVERSSITIPAGSTINLSGFVQNRSSNRFIRLRVTSDSGVNGFQWLFDPTTGTSALAPAASGTGTAGTPTIELVDGGYRINISGLVAPAATTILIQFILQDQGESYSATYTGDGTSGLYLGALQWSVGATLQNYQKVGAGPWDVTEAGMPSGFLPYFGGTQWGLFDTVGFGLATSGLFAGTGFNWYLRIPFRVLANGTIVAQCGAVDASKMFELYVASTLLRLRLRGTDNSSGVAVTTGAFGIAQINCTNGAVTMSVNGGAHTAMSVGVAAAEAVKITLFCRTETSPASIATGRGLPLFMDRFATVQEMAQDFAYCQATYGSAV